MLLDLLIIGIILFLDGIISVIAKGAHGWVYDGGRVIRSYIGVSLIVMAYLGLGTWGWALLIGFGVWTVLDGMGSIFIEGGQIHDITRDGGRIFRALLGLILVVIGMMR